MSIIQSPVTLRHLAIAAGVTLGSIAMLGCSGDDDDDAATDDTQEPADDAGQSDYNDDGASSDTTAAAGGDAAGGTAVAYAVDAIEYTDVAAPAGGTIEITNNSGAPHTFTADDGGFNVEYGADAPATVEVPAEPGDYTFHCEIHPSMQATLTAQ